MDQLGQLIRFKSVLDQLRTTEEYYSNLGQEINLLSLQIQKERDELTQIEKKDVQESRAIWSRFRSLKTKLDREIRFLDEEQNSERWAMEKCLSLASECATSGDIEGGLLQAEQSQVHLKRMYTIGGLIAETKARIQEAEATAQEKVSDYDCTSHRKAEDSLEKSQKRLKELTYKFEQLKQELTKLKTELDLIKLYLS